MNWFGLSENLTLQLSDAERIRCMLRRWVSHLSDLNIRLTWEWATRWAKTHVPTNIIYFVDLNKSNIALYYFIKKILFVYKDNFVPHPSTTSWKYWYLKKKHLIVILKKNLRNCVGITLTLKCVLIAQWPKGLKDHDSFNIMSIASCLISYLLHEL